MRWDHASGWRLFRWLVQFHVSLSLLLTKRTPGTAAAPHQPMSSSAPVLQGDKGVDGRNRRHHLTGQMMRGNAYFGAIIGAAVRRPNHYGRRTFLIPVRLATDEIDGGPFRTGRKCC